MNAGLSGIHFVQTGTKKWLNNDEFVVWLVMASASAVTTAYIEMHWVR